MFEVVLGIDSRESLGDEGELLGGDGGIKRDVDDDAEDDDDDVDANEVTTPTTPLLKAGVA